MRGIEALVKPGTHIRLVFDHHMPCIAKVIVSKGRRVKGGSWAKPSRGLRLSGDSAA